MVPVSIEIKNFFSHKESFIDFTAFNSALLIGNIDGDYSTSNGSGKSAIFEAILWSLFNKSRADVVNDIVHWGEGKCKVSFVFNHLGDIYKVVRIRSRGSSTTRVTFFKQNIDGEWIDISGSTSSLTNDAIVNTIKFDYKTFINSAYFRQNDISEFAETDPSRKKEILKSIIDISKWDSYERIIKDKVRELLTESKVLESKIVNYETLSHDYEKFSKDLDDSKASLSEYIKKRNLDEHSLNTMIERYQVLKSTLDTGRWDNVSEELAGLRLRHKELSEKAKNYKKNLDFLSKKINLLSQKNDSFKKAIASLEVDPDVDDKVSRINTEAVELKTTLGIAKNKLSELNDLNITSESCYVCKQNISEELHSELTSLHKEEVEKNQKTMVFCKNKLLELSSKKEKLLIISSNNKKLKNYELDIRNNSAELSILSERYNELSAELKTSEELLAKTSDSISINEQILDSIRNDDFKNLNKRIKELKEELSLINKRIEDENHKVGALTEKTSSLKKMISDIEKVRVIYLKKQNEISTMKRMAKFLGKNGIQTILLNAIIEDLESSANKVLTSICNEGFVLYLDTQRVGADGHSVVETLDLRVKKDDVVQNFKSLSGGEKFRIALALRIALSEISSRHSGSSLEFLLLDEINSPLDKNGTESLFTNVIKSLEKKYKILVITHNESLKEKFSDIIDVTKVGGESTVRHISV